MMSPVPSTTVVINGADTTAGSMAKRRKTRGKMAAMAADQTTMLAAVTATTIPICTSTASDQARPPARRARGAVPFCPRPRRGPGPHGGAPRHNRAKNDGGGELFAQDAEQ